MNEDILMAALAGLLHDIGKFAQRAGEDVSADWRYQKNRQDFGYQHALHTWNFVNRYLPEQLNQAGLMAAYHHRPNGDGRLVQIADHLSAGEPRQNGKGDDADKKQHPLQLQSIFCSVKTTAIDQKGIEVQTAAAEKQYLPLAPLSLSKEVIFPGKALPQEQALKNYKTLWDAFCSEAEALKKVHTASLNLEMYLESMQDLLHRYTWSIPAAYFKAVPDVSLYDHSRMTAALSALLVKSGLSEAEIEAIRLGTADQNKPLALLIGGDISGVQEFIYTITSRGAAKTLRGRSFYLQLLTEAALRFVLTRLDLPYTNVIYSGGGNFFILAPADAAPLLAGIRRELSTILLKHHGTALYLALGSAEVLVEGFKQGGLPKYWDQMHKDLNQVKQQRYTELGTEMYSLVFEVPAFGGNPDDTCSVCGDDQRKTSSLGDDEEKGNICSLCSSFQDIGRELPGSQFAVFQLVEPKAQPRNSAASALEELGFTFKFLKDVREKPVISTSRTVVWALDDPEKAAYPEFGPAAAHQLHYTAKQVPGSTLDYLMGKVEGGFSKLGVIRLDVDNVGELFKHGLGSAASLSRIAALSSSLSLFFEGWVKKICAEKDRAGKIYTVYTGGDDAFLVGPWDSMPQLAREISNEFKAYCAGHSGLTLSAGMSFIGGKYPIYQAAEDAGEALEDAKHSGKDAFHFLGRSWKWSEFASIEARFEQVVNIVSEDKLNGPQTLIQVLRSLSEQKTKRVREKGADVWGPWQWRGAYTLKRMEEREKSPVLAGEIRRIRQSLDSNNYSELDQWGTAARWAQLHTRKSNK